MQIEELTLSLDLFTGIPYGFEDFGRYRLYDWTTAGKTGKTTVIYELCVFLSLFSYMVYVLDIFILMFLKLFRNDRL